MVTRPRAPAPKPDGKEDAYETERASASVIAPVASTEAPQDASPAGDVRSVEGPFGDLLDWFSTVVTNPKSAADGVAQAEPIQARLGAERVEGIVKPTDRMTAVERMGIYQYAYHARLVGCLEDDYPVVADALGASRFELLARKYIEAHPSDRPNLNPFGRHFPEFVATQKAWLDDWAFIRDLARLEWALVEVLHAAPHEGLSMASLEALPQVEWPEIRLPPSPTLRFLELDYPVNAYFQANRRGESVAIPAPSPSATAVYRVGYRLWRMDLSPAMAEVLGALVRGATLGEALACLEDPRFAEEVKETQVMVWFKEWVVGGFFAPFERPTD